MTGEQHTLLVGQHRHRPAPFEDGGSDFVEVGLAMKPGVVRVGYQPLDRPALELVGRPRTRRALILSTTFFMLRNKMLIRYVYREDVCLSLRERRPCRFDITIKLRSD